MQASLLQRRFGPGFDRFSYRRGPPGSNLFIFHIPNEMTNRWVFI